LKVKSWIDTDTITTKTDPLYYKEQDITLTVVVNCGLLTITEVTPWTNVGMSSTDFNYKFNSAKKTIKFPTYSIPMVTSVVPTTPLATY
jgi:hypothetical protein